MHPIENCFNPQVQQAFDLMLQTFQDEGLDVRDCHGKKVEIDQLAQKVLEASYRRAGGTFNSDHLEAIRKMTKMSKELTGDKAAKLFCGKSIHGPLKDKPLFNPNFPAEKTYRLAVDYFTKGGDPARVEEWYRCFNKDIMYATNGVAGGITEGSEATVTDLRTKAGKVPSLTFGVFPPPLIVGNMCATLVNNKFSSDSVTGKSHFVLASINFINSDVTPEDEKSLTNYMLANIDMPDFVSEVAALGHQYEESFVDLAERIGKAVTNTLRGAERVALHTIGRIISYF